MAGDKIFSSTGCAKDNIWANKIEVKEKKPTVQSNYP